MDLILIRHAIAQDKAAFTAKGKPDSARPLTDSGRRKMKRAAKGLARIAPKLNVLATSPFTRAAQTADILAKHYKVRPVQVPDLAKDGDPRRLQKWLNGRKINSTVALVGHEPDLGRLAAWLLSDGRKSFIELKKGGACLIETGFPVRGGGGKLIWLLKPSELRRLA